MRSFKVLHGGTYSCLQLNDAHAIIRGLEKDWKFQVICCLGKRIVNNGMNKHQKGSN